ncbi:protein EFR3 homolog cmp44E-like [Penaeus indicus]|uniref:protein EFR3 homolog cmp44E-like n=1 Tax=Penaeus indicus TaxID=29960 RepID=UPI00300D3B13
MASYESGLPCCDLPEDLLFDHSKVLDLLANTNLDEKRLNTSMSSMMRRHSTTQHTSSATDINSISVEVDSACSSPGLPRRTLEEEITFESLKKVLTESPEQRRKAEEERRKQITEAFMTESFEALVAKIQAKQPDTLQTKLSEIFSRLPPTCPPSSSAPTSVSSASAVMSCDGVPGLASPVSSVYELPYPDIFIY